MKRRLENTDERKGDDEEKESKSAGDEENKEKPKPHKRRKMKHERKTVVPPENTIVWKSYKKSMPKIPREVTEKLTEGIVSKNPETFVWSLSNPAQENSIEQQNQETITRSNTQIVQQKEEEEEDKERQALSKEKMSIKKLLDE